jgi:hypothetical protein
MKQENKGQRDSLTSLEWCTYQLICWICLVGVISSAYFGVKSGQMFGLWFCLLWIFGAIGCVFRLGLKDDIRVFDLRRFGGGD